MVLTPDGSASVPGLYCGFAGIPGGCPAFL